MKHHSPTIKVTGKGNGHKMDAPSGNKNPKKKRTMNYDPAKMKQ